MKTCVKLAIGAFIILGILFCLMIWKDEIFKPKTEIELESMPYYENRILIIDKKTRDTIFDKNIKSMSPMELDSITLYLNK
jgi:hypothetical protein